MKRIKKHDLILVSLNREQIEIAKSVNGKRKNISMRYYVDPMVRFSGQKSNV